MTDEQKKIIWDSLPDHYKIQHVMSDVLGWECFISWDAYLRKYGKQEWEIGAGKPFTTPTHVAFWNFDEWRVFTPDHQDLKRYFDPLHTMSDAWLVLEKMKEGNWRTFCYELDSAITQHTRRGWDESTDKPYVTWFEQFMKSLLNAEGICIAALRTCGVEVIYEQSTRDNTAQ